MLTLYQEDERSIANKLAAEERRGEEPDSPEVAQLKRDPTLPVSLVEDIKKITIINDFYRLSCTAMSPPRAPRSILSSRPRSKRS